MSILEAEGLSRYYGSRVGLDRLDLVLREGSICGFLGPNGVGKTTAIRLLLGFLKPSGGRARIFGLDCWRQGPRIREEVGYIPGDLRLYSWMTARRALHLFGRIRRRNILVAGLELAGDFGLELDVRVSSMSRGMRQKLGLVLALAHEPRLLILDEPTSGLDPVMQEKLKQRLLDLSSRGHTVFFSSHTLSEVERLCERVVILQAGRVVADDLVKNLRARARRQVILVWREGAAGIEPPPGLEILERQERSWQGFLKGPVKELLGWLADQPLLDDVVIGQPDMEALFQQYYIQEFKR